MDESLELPIGESMKIFLVAEILGCCLTRSMSVAFNLKSNTIFEIVPEGEMDALYSDIYNNSVALVGRCDDGSAIVFRPAQRGDGFVVIK